MPWHDAIEPVAMLRLAIVAPAERLREALVELADAGTVQVELADEVDAGPAGEALRRLRAAVPGAVEPALSAAPRTIEDLERGRRADLLAGEVELARRAGAAVGRGRFEVLLGWCPEAEVSRLRPRLERLGGAVVVLPRRPFVDPPTMLRTARVAGPFRPLVDTYGTVPYADIDPTPFTAATFVLMFGMMFADAGQGLLLAAAGLYLRFTRRPRLRKLRANWLVPFLAGLCAAAFGLAYGEAFGPTGLVPVLWLEPMRDPLRLMTAGVLVGAVLLAISYLIGTANRWREGGPRLAVYSTSGLAGLLLFGGLAGLAVGIYTRLTPVEAAAGALCLLGLALTFVGLLAEAGARPSGVFQAGVELINSVIRLVANAISFARLAAFGLVHAALGGVVWGGTIALASMGLWYAAIPVFVAGNAVTFGLELVVAGIQALRLEYYELYSRIYAAEGRPFIPWHLPVLKEPA